MNDELDQQDIVQAIERGVNAYFEDCRSGVTAFVRNQFRYPGAWHTNKRAWGWDMLRAPCNLFFAPVYVVLMLVAWLFNLLALPKLSHYIKQIPSGFTTDVQRYIANLIVVDLLKGEEGLERYIVAELSQQLPPSEQQLLSEKLKPIVHQTLEQYAITRTASADISNSLLSSAVGAFAFKKFTPGGLAIGIYLAMVLSYHLSVRDFFLGETLGTLYYSLFPPEPSALLMVMSVAVVLFVLATLSSFSGLLIDPLQSWLGIHKRRLQTMLNSMQQDLAADGFLGQTGGTPQGSFRPKDPYLARILEVLDAAKSQLP